MVDIKYLLEVTKVLLFTGKAARFSGLSKDRVLSSQKRSVRLLK